MKPLLPLALLMTACSSATPLPAPPPLAGSEWGPADQPDIFVQFGPDGALAASAGCNTLGATYTQDGSRLTISPIRATRMMCPPDMMEREALLTAQLNATAQAGIEDDGKLGLLILMDGSGKPLAKLHRRDWD